MQFSILLSLAIAMGAYAHPAAETTPGQIEASTVTLWAMEVRDSVRAIQARETEGSLVTVLAIQARAAGRTTHVP